MPDATPVPTWRLDDLDAESRREELDALKTFVDWLDANGVTAPACWFTHGWIRQRLAAMFAWWIHVSDGKEAAAWWSELQNITQSSSWTEAHDHGMTHIDRTTGGRVRHATFAEAVRELCAAEPAEEA